ncbi:SDR family oxidoreductase [Solirubrobacter sp. CPCC 204708]|uniref:SDR family oxidoreductase n=1 Tax=Solirubrobacter deserti TaxID=2282478 RepID=A0ABT4RJ16_9ACTN|nr:SDR family oxidoreductase [Solirubrobacter deserti]MBE2320912.1 SDR family oxidoreductase [Solirubrobacter deserti]MDA0138548.1 SDR family oxidoreductase [Solirubrobacter deserti]
MNETSFGRLRRKVAVVTGGTAGIGLAAAKRFAAEGATVYVTGRRPAELEAAVGEIGPRATGVSGDVAELDDLDRLYATVEERGDRIDVLFANAGGGEFLPLAHVTPEHVDRIFGANVRGLIFTVQKALPLLADGASIIVNGSTAAVSGTPRLGVYGASKAAAHLLSRTWANELSPRGIRVNVLAPGYIDTPGITAAANSDDERDVLRKELARGIPLGRLGHVDETAAAVLYLASDESTFVTGAQLVIDGGQLHS